MRKIIFLIGFLISIGAMAQGKLDTIFYDKNWKVSSKVDASFYRISVKEKKGFTVSDYYVNGTLQMTGFFKSFDPDMKTGPFKYYNKNGSLEMEGVYKSDKKDGEWKDYDSTGILFSVTNYESGKRNGKMIYYYSNGVVKRDESYKEGEFLDGKCFSSTGEEIEFFPYEEDPKYIGGMSAFSNFLGTSIVYPEKAEKEGIQGRVLIGFVIDKNGEVIEEKVLKSVHPLLDQEALRVVKNMPNWIPGKIDGNPIKTRYQVPINFKLDNVKVKK